MKVYGQLERAALENNAGSFGATITGRLWYNTSTGVAEYGDGSSVRVLVNTDQSQTLSSKTLSGALVSNYLDMDGQASDPANPAAGDFRLFFGTDGKFYFLNSSGAKQEIGAGSGGGGGINYIDNGSAEEGATTGWQLFTMGTPGVYPAGAISDGATGFTISTTSTAANVERGDYSFLLQKSTGDQQGQGVYYPFTIDNADKHSVFEVSLDYTGGSYSSGDFRAYVLSSDDSFSTYTVHEVTPVEIQDGTNVTHKGYFQTHASNTDYRFLILNTVTTTAVKTFYFDNVQVGPVSGQSTTSSRVVAARGYCTAASQQITNSTTMFVDFPTTGSTTFDTHNAIVGAGSGPNSTYTSTWRYIVPESGYYHVSADINLATNSDFANAEVFNLSVYVNGSNWEMIDRQDSLEGTNIEPKCSGSTVVKANKGDAISIATFQNSGANINLNTSTGSNSVSIYKIGSVDSSSDGRLVAARYTCTAASQTITNATTEFVDFPTADYDTHSAVSGAGSGPNGTYTSTWRYVAPEAGKYRVSAYLVLAGVNTWAVDEIFITYVYVNGVLHSFLKRFNGWAGGTALEADSGGTTVVDLQKGDIISLGCYQNSGGDLNLETTAGANHIEIEKLQGPSQPMPSEVVAARYAVSASTAKTAFADEQADEVIDYDTQVYDTHGAVTTGTGWKFTAPITGKYSVSAVFEWANTTNLTLHLLQLYKNGSEDVRLMQGVPTIPSMQGSVDVELDKGEYIQIVAYQNDSTGSPGASRAPNTGGSATKRSYVSIHRIGGVS